MKILGMFFIAILMTVFAFATGELPVPIPDVTNTEFLEALLAAIGGAQGASTLAIAALVIQLLFKLLGTPMFANVWNKIKGKQKFIIVGLLSIASLTVVQMQATGVSLGVALMHSTVVSALMNYGYRFYELFIEKKNK